MNKLVALIAVSTVALASCSNSGGQMIDNWGLPAENITEKGQMIDNGGLPAENNSTALDGTKWELPEYNATVDFENGRYYASAGCNGISGTYTTNNEKHMTFNDGMTTLMMCPDEVMKNEQGLQEFIKSVQNYELKDGELTLSGEKLSYTLSKAKNSSLTESEWELNSLLVNQGVVSHTDFSDSKLSFSKDGKISGVAVCNNIMGSYTIDGNTIDISNLASTRKACLSDEANKYEAQIIETLENVNSFEIERTSLQLKSEDEKYRINYSVK